MGSGYYDYGNASTNTGIKMQHIQASIEDNKLKVEGYIKINKIDVSRDLIIHIDDFAATT